MASLKYEAIAKLPSGKDGKVRWHKCGAVFESDKGLSLKIESIPVGFDGWLSLREPSEKPQAAAPPQRQPTPGAAPGFDDDIPF